MFAAADGTEGGRRQSSDEPEQPASPAARHRCGLRWCLDGALLRWALSAGLNHLFPSIPPGTLIANVIGGYLVGVAVALFAQQPGWPAEWRLFVITGFLGGLTTFSTFLAEVVLLLQ